MATTVIKVCCTNGIHLQIKTQHEFRLKHRYLVVTQASIKWKKHAGKKKKETADKR